MDIREGILGMRLRGWAMDRATTYDSAGKVRVQARYARVPNEAIRSSIRLREHGEYESAVDAITQAAHQSVVASDPSALVTRSLALSGLGQQDAALHDLSVAEKRLYEQLGMVIANRSTFLVIAGRFDEAAVAAAEAVRLLPARWDISADLMVALEMRGDESEAESELGRIAGVLADAPMHERVEAAEYIAGHAGLVALASRVDIRRVLNCPKA